MLRPDRWRTAEESLYGGPERPLCEVLKVKSALSWRPQDIEDDRVPCGGELQIAGNQPKRQRSMLQSTKTEETKRPEKQSNKPFGTIHRDAGSESGLLGLVQYLLSAPSLHFYIYVNIYSISLYVESIDLPLDFTGVYN